MSDNKLNSNPIISIDNTSNEEINCSITVINKTKEPKLQ